MSETICVQCMHAGPGIPEAVQLRHWALNALPPGCSGGELTIRIVDEPEGRQLNRHWRGGAGATNVLSFPAAAPAQAGSEWLGDVVICAPVAAQEAREAGVEPHAHWAHLVVHGVLHLLGYDHEQEDEALRMERLETRILQRLGFPDPYRGRT